MSALDLKCHAWCKLDNLTLAPLILIMRAISSYLRSGKHAIFFPLLWSSTHINSQKVNSLSFLELNKNKIFNFFYHDIDSKHLIMYQNSEA